MNAEERWIPPVSAESDARDKLRIPIWRRWWSQARRWPQRLFTRGSVPGDRTALRLVSLPVAVIEVRLETAAPGSRPVHLFVHGFSGQVEARRLEGLQTEPIPDEVRRFSYPLSDGETLNLARQAVSRLRLGRLIKVPAGREMILQIRGLLYHPYWVLYEQRSGGRVSFRMVDAVVGCRGGALLRNALVRALNHEAGSTSDQPSVAAIR